MAVGTEVEIPAALNRAGSGAREIAGSARTVGAHPVGETHSASRNFDAGNWEGGLGTALSALTETWSAQVSALVADCNSLAGRCTETGTLYQRTEATNTRIMTSSLPSEPSPFG
ncbi:type VII secretion target [Streptomyces endophyticus]|uniref:Type VII secretion target n=1 Tax=Streptomyces endophyticus TaxID=714166 RepID=A0ABU6F6H3_9ACTN|nr:type VII secretion target [Streptomyces endophyticus]MEB8339622.1 type VII secretion target [Streptomyces endophyticus]